MKYIQTIENLYKKALKKGSATLNGRYRDYSYIGELEEKYYIEVTETEIFMRHWGTETLRINRADNSVVSYYGESNSDRDSMNTLLYLVGNQSDNFRYGSVMGFVHESKNMEVSA